MLVFLKKVFLFILPVGLFFAFPLVVFIVSKEYYSVPKAIRYQTENPEALVGFAYGGDDISFKEKLVAEKNPEVFALGASITGEFRKEFFIESANFVTASNAVVTINDMKSFVENLPLDNKTKLIIFGFTARQTFFSPDMSNSKKTKMTAATLLDRSRLIYWQYMTGKFSLKTLWEKSRSAKKIGMTAYINNDGFRGDGSYQYDKILTDSNRKEILQSSIDGFLSDYQKNRELSGYEHPFLDTTTNSLVELLELCKKKNIYAIGFLQPYPSEMYQEFTKFSDSNMKKTSKTLEEIFTDNDFAFFDFSDISVLGLKKNNTEFVDWGHGTDKLYLRMVMHMAEKNEELRNYVDMTKDRQLLQNTKKDFIDSL
jgi:hypothetical protein